jgi:hypothetical protein
VLETSLARTLLAGGLVCCLAAWLPGSWLQPAGFKNTTRLPAQQHLGLVARGVSPCATPKFCRRKRLNSGRFSSLSAPMLRSAGYHLQSHGKPISLPLTRRSTARRPRSLWMPSQPAWPPGRPRCDAVSGRLPTPSACTEHSLQTTLPDALARRPVRRWPAPSHEPRRRLAPKRCGGCSSPTKYRYTRPWSAATQACARAARSPSGRYLHSQGSASRPTRLTRSPPQL